MFGERYFATRGRLSEVMHGIAELAKETGTDLDERLPFAEMEKGLGTPFLFVVCGFVFVCHTRLLLFGVIAALGISRRRVLALLLHFARRVVLRQAAGLRVVAGIHFVVFAHTRNLKSAPTPPTS